MIRVGMSNPKLFHRICGNCRFWVIEECHRWPPVLDYKLAEIVGAPINLGLWPRTNRDDQCGEWKPVGDYEEAPHST